MNRAILISVAIAIAATSALGADRKAVPRPRPAPAATQAAAPQAAHALLSPAETASIRAVLQSSSGSVTVACGGPWCSGLAAGVAKAFGDAGWAVHRINHGGIGVDGVSGIRVGYCQSWGQKASDALAATGRRVEVQQETGCSILIDREVFVTLGVPGD